MSLIDDSDRHRADALVPGPGGHLPRYLGQNFWRKLEIRIDESHELACTDTETTAIAPLFSERPGKANTPNISTSSRMQGLTLRLIERSVVYDDDFDTIPSVRQAVDFIPQGASGNPYQDVYLLRKASGIVVTRDQPPVSPAHR